MIRRPPRSTLDRSSAASDVYKRQGQREDANQVEDLARVRDVVAMLSSSSLGEVDVPTRRDIGPVSYTHLRAHETVLDLVCRLLLEKKNQTKTDVQPLYDTNNINN